MRAEIIRSYLPAETLGELIVWDDQNDEAFRCKTLELPWKNNANNISCIPEGEYLVVKRKAHNLRKYDHFHVTDVKGRTWILIHTGNKISHIQGCILVGNEFKHIDNDGNLDVVNSTVTLKVLYSIMPDKFKLNITNNKSNGINI